MLKALICLGPDLVTITKDFDLGAFSAAALETLGLGEISLTQVSLTAVRRLIILTLK